MDRMRDEIMNQKVAEQKISRDLNVQLEEKMDLLGKAIKRNEQLTNQNKQLKLKTDRLQKDTQQKLLKQSEEKESEIQVLKDMIKSTQTQFK